MNFLAAIFSACMRLGGTSVAFMEGETSIATMMVARSWGTRTAVAGRAQAATMTIRARMKKRAGMWRRQPGRLGAT